MKTRKTTHLSAGFLTKAPLGRSFFFFYLFARLIITSGLLCITQNSGEIQHDTTNVFGDERLRRLVFNIINRRLLNRVAVILGATTTITTTKSVCLCV